VLFRSPQNPKTPYPSKNYNILNNYLININNNVQQEIITK